MVLSSPDFSEINEKFRAGPEDEGEEYEQEEDSKDLVRYLIFNFSTVLGVDPYASL